ncbi:hypothetical protein Bpfe_001341, partial [Biomphalaria pfeifferi]
ALQLTSNESLKTFSFKKGNLFSYNFTVYGYPEPDQFKIVRFNQFSNNVIATHFSLEPPD